jgi:adenine-specific DNA methylase
MEIRVIDKTELGAKVSPHGNKYIPIHNWYAYKHGFSRELAEYLIKEFNLYEGCWVLDPFCGSGTTLLTCKELGINAQGFDILPFSVLLTNVKISDYDVGDLEQQLSLFEEIMKEGKRLKKASLPDIPLLRKAFKPEVEQRLLELKSAINKIDVPKVRSFFNLGFLNILESVSNTSKAGGFLRIIKRDVDSDAIERMFLNKVKSMIKDIIGGEDSKKDSNVSVMAEVGDARRLITKRKFDAVITSPPYPNRHDYTRIYTLEMAFDFISTNDELKKIRYDTIRSHVEAKKKYEITGYKKPEILESLIEEVRRNGTNNPQVTGMIEGYFEDMYMVLSEISRCLKKGCKAGLVVSNVRFSGVNIPVDELLAGIGVQVGLNPKEVLVVRYRGNSSQQMRDYTRKPSRESIVIWQKDI